jgi:transposase
MSERVRIISLRDRRTSVKSISKILKIKESTVKHIINKWNLYDTIEDRPKCGRPAALSDRSTRVLVRNILSKKVKTATELTNVAREDYGIDICPKTARNILHKSDLKVVHGIPKPDLTPEHKRKRLEFALAHINWSVDDWKNVIFSDEVLITSRPVNARHLIWTKSTDPLNPDLIIPTIQGGGSKIMVWSCISKFGFHDLVRLEGSVDALKYLSVLHDYLLPTTQQYFDNRPYLFQQDNAAIHTARIVSDFFQQHNVNVVEWPANSPDLNIIEHVWRYLKIEIYKVHIVNNKEKLWERVQSVMQTMWSEEMTVKINQLYESLPRRMQAVIVANGGNTKY